MARPDLAAGSKPQQKDGFAGLSHQELVERCRLLTEQLSDREQVLRELQHRAKNSLQLVISMLRLQHHRINEPVARAAYDQTMFRVEVLAILYRQIHEARSEVSVDLSQYAQEICETALGNVGDLETPVHVSVNAEPLRTSLYTAMPLGLIINELVMSGLRHAYPAEGQMEVRLEDRNGQAVLTVSDNGRGLPPGFDSDADASAMLVEALATQLGADLDIQGGHGTTVRLTLQL